MHDSGPRASGPFVEVNCAAIPETLLEAELFGYEAGAFSEAKRAKPGLMETASGGTLFLDEIDSMPLSLQGKLLTALEAKRVRRLGAVREQAVDVKLIAAAQAELREAVEVGRFRADLFHRLAVVVLALPPLRTLGEDILVLARAYLHRYAAAHRVHPKRLSPAAEAWLLGYPWPGNVRELSHLLERITLLEPAEVVDVQAIERLCLSQPASFATMAPGSSPTDDASLDDTARIQQALQQTGGNVLRAARLLGMSRSSLRYRMLRAGIARPQVAEAGAPPPPPPGTTRSRGAPGHGPPPEIIAAGPPAAWEERPVAVLAVDLTFPQGNNSERPSYEPWTVATRWEQAIREKVEGFGGVLVQHAVAPLLGAFGVPTALEQMPQRAVHAALAIRQLVAEAQVGGSGSPVRRCAWRCMWARCARTCRPRSSPAASRRWGRRWPTRSGCSAMRRPAKSAVTARGAVGLRVVCPAATPPGRRNGSARPGRGFHGGGAGAPALPAGATRGPPAESIRRAGPGAGGAA